MPRLIIGAACAALALCPSAALHGSPVEDRGAIGAVVGSVVDARDKGVSEAPVRLRNLASGKVDGTGRSNAAGQFAFERVVGGSYIVEVVDRAGNVVAVGHTFVVLPGETVATIVRLAGRTRWFPGLFGNAAAAAVATAASLGVTAVAPTGQAVSGAR
jgi:hypothetical protein